MQLYYFDTYDGVVTIDDEGTWLPDLVSARQRAQLLLRDMLVDAEASRDSSAFRADIRDETGRRLVTATVVLNYEAC